MFYFQSVTLAKILKLTKDCFAPILVFSKQSVMEVFISLLSQ